MPDGLISDGEGNTLRTAAGLALNSMPSLWACSTAEISPTGSPSV